MNKRVKLSAVQTMEAAPVASPRYRICMRLRELRQEARLTQTSVAREMEISNSALP